MVSYAYFTDRHIITATWVGTIYNPEGDVDKSQIFNELSILTIEKQRDISNILETSKPAPPIVKTTIPDWIRNNAEWWASGLIPDRDFASGIQYLIKQKIMIIPEGKSSVIQEETKNRSETEDGFLQVDAKEYVVSSNKMVQVKVTGDYYDYDNWRGTKFLDITDPDGNTDEIEIWRGEKGEFDLEIPFTSFFKTR